MVGVAGCHSGLLLWPCGHSKLYPVAAAGVLLWRRGSLYGAQWASGLDGVLRVSLIKKKKKKKLQ